VILIANKYDLRRDYKLISDDKIRNYAKNKNWYFFYTSALDNYNIREVFQKAATLAYNNIITKN
jgi:GTPase SAR1 family protein